MAIDTELADALKQARQAPMRFAFVAKGPAEGKLLVAKKSIPAKEVAAAKDKLGGGLLFRGRCLSENGTLVFEVPKPPPATLAKQLKTIITRDAGLTQKVEVRVAPDLEGEIPPPPPPPPPGAMPKAGTVPPAPPPPPGADKAAVLKRLSALAGPYQAAVAAQGPEVSRMQSLFSAVKGLLGSQDFAQAGKVLDELEPLVAQAGTAKPPAASAAERFRERLARVGADFERLKAALPERAAPLQAMMNLAQKRGQEQKYEPGLGVLAELDARVQAALRTLPGVPPPPPPPPPPQGADKAAVLKRFSALAPALKTALAGPQGARLQGLVGTANGFLKSADFAQAAKVLDQLEPLLARPGSTNVVFTQARLVWDQTRKKIQAELQKLEPSILGVCLDPELEQEEFDFSTLAADTKELYTILDHLDTRLLDKLDEALNAADPQQRARLQGEAAGIVKEYLAYVQGNPLLGVIDSNGFTTVAVRQTTLNALNLLASKL